MTKKKYPCQKLCQNGAEGCGMEDVTDCVRFMPLQGTNLIEIKGIVETPPNIDTLKFSQYFMNFIDAVGWIFHGSCSPYKEDEE